MADFTDDEIEEVWEKGVAIPRYNKDKYRKDMCGAWIQKDKYGDENSLFGWDIDHIYPKQGNEEEGLKSIAEHKEVNNIDNLQPLQIKNNRAEGKSNNYPTFTCKVQANDNKNVESEEEFTISEDIQEKLRKLYDLE